MRKKLEEINDIIRDCLPIALLTSWLCMVALCIKVLFGATIR